MTDIKKMTKGLSSRVVPKTFIQTFKSLMAFLAGSNSATLPSRLRIQDQLRVVEQVDVARAWSGSRTMSRSKCVAWCGSIQVQERG